MMTNAITILKKVFKGVRVHTLNAKNENKMQKANLFWLFSDYIIHFSVQTIFLLISKQLFTPWCMLTPHRDKGVYHIVALPCLKAKEELWKTQNISPCKKYNLQNNPLKETKNPSSNL
jgi:hypothetical protein